MYHPVQEIFSLNHTRPTEVKWAIVGKKGELDECFPLSADFFGIGTKEGTFCLRHRPLNETIVVKWRKNKLSDRIFWSGGITSAGDILHRRLGLQSFPNSQMPQAPSFSNRLYYCMGLAHLIVLNGDLELRSYVGRDVEANRMLWVKKPMLPDLSHLQEDMAQKGFAVKTQNEENSEHNIAMVFRYLWMHLPYDFTGKDQQLKLHCLRHTKRWLRD